MAARGRRRRELLLVVLGVRTALRRALCRRDHLHARHGHGVPHVLRHPFALEADAGRGVDLGSAAVARVEQQLAGLVLLYAAGCEPLEQPEEVV